MPSAPAEDRAAGADYTIGEVALLVGVSTDAIRAWERRYRIVVPRRTRSRQRRYTAREVEILRRVRHNVTAGGMPLPAAAEAARGKRAPGRMRERAAAEAGRPLAWPAGADQWQVVADLLKELIVVLDGTGRIVEANVAVARAVGTIRGRLPGVPFADLVEPFDRAKAVMAYRLPFQRRRRWELNLRTNGSSRLYSFDCWPMRSGGRPLLALIGRLL